MHRLSLKTSLCCRVSNWLKCKCVNIDCQDVQLKVPRGSWGWWRVAHFSRAAAAPAVEFNACPPMEINYRSQLGGFTCDEWARLGEDEVSLALLLPPLPPHRANTNACADFVSLHKEGGLRYAKIICDPRGFTREPRTDLESRRSSRPVWASLRWCPGSTPGSGCSRRSKDTVWAPDWQQVQKNMFLLFHLGEVKIVGVGLLASQTDRDEDDHGSVRPRLLLWIQLRLRLLGLHCPVAVHHICTVHCAGSMRLRLAAGHSVCQSSNLIMCTLNALIFLRHQGSVRKLTVRFFKGPVRNIWCEFYWYTCYSEEIVQMFWSVKKHQKRDAYYLACYFGTLFNISQSYTDIKHWWVTCYHLVTNSNSDR